MKEGSSFIGHKIGQFDHKLKLLGANRICCCCCIILNVIVVIVNVTLTVIVIVFVCELKNFPHIAQKLGQYRFKLKLGLCPGVQAHKPCCHDRCVIRGEGRLRG